MDLINFRVGKKTISLKILDILLTERFEDNLTSLPNDNKSFIGVKDYMDIPTPIFDLGIILNGQSTQAANQAVSNILEDWELKLQEWFQSVQYSINNAQPFTCNTDIEQSAFIKWVRCFKTNNHELKVIIEKFEAPYVNLLTSAKNVVAQSKSDHNPLLKNSFDTVRNSDYLQLKRLFESAKEQVALDYKPIIIFTTKDGLNPHIGLLVDKVEIVSVIKKKTLNHWIKLLTLVLKLIRKPKT